MLCLIKEPSVRGSLQGPAISINDEGSKFGAEQHLPNPLVVLGAVLALGGLHQLRARPNDIISTQRTSYNYRMNSEVSRLPREPTLDEKYRKLKKKFAGLALEHRKLLGDY